MMTGYRTQQSFGLDIGQAAIKGVLLEKTGRHISVVESGILDCRAEGILDQAELCRELEPWLQSRNWLGRETVAGIPQYLAGTQTSDFPKSSDRNLDEMVSFETRNLAGLSDDTFIFDYALMPDPAASSNPVLIGLCRESVVQERTDMLEQAGIQLADCALAGIALANACFHLYPDTAETTSPQLVLDIGAESSTIVIIAHSSVRFTASLLFGTDRFAQIVAQQLNIPLEEAERQLRARQIALDPLDATLTAAVQPLENEIRTALDHWKAQERGELARLQFSRVFLCGGGAWIQGMDRVLGRLFDCPAQVIGVPTSPGGQPDPVYVCAYGLALQGLSAARFDVSLALPQTRWRTRRRRRFVFLAAAAILAGLLVTALEVGRFVRLDQRENELQKRMSELAACNAIVPDLENVIRDIDHHQRMLLPFAEKGNHARRFHSAIRLLAQARQGMIDGAGAARAVPEEGWVIYLADQQSFQGGKEALSKDDAAAPGGTLGGSPFRPLLGPAGVLSGTADTGSDQRRLVTDIRPWTGLVAAVYTATEANEPYRLVRLFVSELNKTALFEGVDLMPEPESAGREDIFLSWSAVPEGMIPATFKRFFLKLPFETLDVRRPPAANAK
jgi:type IV pilus assembly protein PilM